MARNWLSLCVTNLEDEGKDVPNPAGMGGILDRLPKTDLMRIDFDTDFSRQK